MSGFEETAKFRSSEGNKLKRITFTANMTLVFILQKLLPLRNVYSTLFSTGLHLQNSLLKLRHIEGLFETLEASKDKETVASFIPTDKQVIDWLQVGDQENYRFKIFEIFSLSGLPRYPERAEPLPHLS